MRTATNCSGLGMSVLGPTTGQTEKLRIANVFRFAPESGHRPTGRVCPLCADCVAKVFLAFGRETLIQGRARTSNYDSKEPTLRFDCYRFLFQRACLATFATQSAITGREQVQRSCVATR